MKQTVLVLLCLFITNNSLICKDKVHSLTDFKPVNFKNQKAVQSLEYNILLDAKNDIKKGNYETNEEWNVRKNKQNLLLKNNDYQISYDIDDPGKFYNADKEEFSIKLNFFVTKNCGYLKYKKIQSNMLITFLLSNSEFYKYIKEKPIHVKVDKNEAKKIKKLTIEYTFKIDNYDDITIMDVTSDNSFDKQKQLMIKSNKVLSIKVIDSKTKKCLFNYQFE